MASWGGDQWKWMYSATIPHRTVDANDSMWEDAGNGALYLLAY